MVQQATFAEPGVSSHLRERHFVIPGRPEKPGCHIQDFCTLGAPYFIASTFSPRSHILRVAMLALNKNNAHTVFYHLALAECREGAGIPPEGVPLTDHEFDPSVQEALRDATWISPVETRPAEPGMRPAYWLRSSFAWTPDTGRAIIHATAHGIYELFVNGVRVGDEELTPGFTSYRKLPAGAVMGHHRSTGQRGEHSLHAAFGRLVPGQARI